MRYRLHDELFGARQRFEIANQHGWTLLVASSAPQSADRLVLRDRAGLERATVVRRALPAGLCYAIERGEEVLALVVRQRTLLGAEVSIRLGVAGELRASGDLDAPEYQVWRGRRAVARATREWGAPAGFYDLDVAPGEHDTLLVAAAVAVRSVAREQGRRGLLRTLLHV